MSRVLHILSRNGKDDPVVINPIKAEEARQSETPLETLCNNITGAGKSGGNPNQTVELSSHLAHNFVKTAVNFLQIVRSILKICSFTIVSDSVLMWSHYGNNHQGFCIEYDLEKFHSGDAFLKNLYPVIYSHQLFDLTPGAEKLVSGSAGQPTTLFPLLGVLQKFEDWAYESHS